MHYMKLFSLCFIVLLVITTSDAHRSRPPYKRGVYVNLYQSDFVNGTYRILESGEYHIREDINFGPKPENDYWNDPRDPYYPIANYYMGFFAGITIEVDDVQIYFHGHTLQQTEEFYLMQRFWNGIELNDKVFIHNEGVAALNYQKQDVIPHKYQTQVMGDFLTVKNVLIHGGTIARTSHIGIHGNGAERVTIKDMDIKGFEVAGIQCNGCKRVIIDRCTVGPSSTEVPALATFSNARFMDLFVNRHIPDGFSSDNLYSSQLLAALVDEFQFADRDEPTMIYDSFVRLHRAIHLYKDYYLGTLGTLNPQQEALLEEAKRVFSNPSGLPDGGVVYGIVLNKLGLPHSDDNFFGAGYESGSIVVQNTEIKGLHARPMQVPALQTVGGDFIQGTSRDVFRIFDVASDQFRVLIDTKYKGDFLSDVYFTMWHLSNAFYRIRVYDSECGNFGSNATIPYAIQPNHADQCLGGINRDPTLTGRKVTIFQKRFFGGLTMTQGLFDWATTRGMTLDKILVSPKSAEEKRSQKHYITCGADTMFHNMQGIIGLKILETKNVKLKNIQIHDIVNTGDAETWVCNQKWKLPENGEVIYSNNFGINDMEGPHVRGVQIVLSDDIQFRRVNIYDLNSDEGNVFGIQVKDDLNDRTDYKNGKGLSFEHSTISNLKSGGMSKAFDLSGTKVSPSSGLTIGSHEELHNGFKNPKTSLLYGFQDTIVPDLYGGPGFYFPSIPVTDLIQQVSTFSTPEKLLAFRNKGLKYHETYYGLKFSDYESTPLDGWITVFNEDGTPANVYILWFIFERPMEYHGLSLCGESGCSELLTDSLVIDVGFALSLTGGINLYGTFGGDEGQWAPPGSSLFHGFYSIENIEVNGVVHDNVQIEYFPVCPITQNSWADASRTVVNSIINCELESPLFGKGKSTGYNKFERVNATHWKESGYSVMVFDDIVDFPMESGVNTNLGDGVAFNFPSKLFAIWADGVLPSPDFSFHLFPLVKNYHYLDESAVRYLLEQTSFDTVDKIAALRKRFLTRLRDDFGVVGVNPDGFDDIPVDSVVDLGGGNRVQAYEVNDAANLRILSYISTDPNEANTLPKGSRIREVGFRLVLGRAGRDTKYGHLPQGTLFTEGVYILENTEYYGSKEEVSFYSKLPVHSDWWSSSVIENQLESTKYGSGTTMLAVTMPMPTSNGKHINIRGSMFFD